jgi:hypothetical protein
MSASIASAILLSASKRWRGVVFDHASYACAAAVTASSTSTASLDGTSASVSPVAGLRTASVRPLRAGTHLPPMKFSWGITRSSCRRVAGIVARSLREGEADPRNADASLYRDRSDLRTCGELLDCEI